MTSDQSWFWTDEWQRGERQVDADIAAGRVTRYDSSDAFLAALADRMTRDERKALLRAVRERLESADDFENQFDDE